MDFTHSDEGEQQKTFPHQNVFGCCSFSLAYTFAIHQYHFYTIIMLIHATLSYVLIMMLVLPVC